MTKVLVVGYGVIGQRLADGVAAQGDMELVGVVDAVPSLSIRALKDRGMPYRLFAANSDAITDLEAAGITVSGTLEEVIPTVDIVLDATVAGMGAKNKVLYQKYGVKAIFQGGEANEVAEVFFHSYVNYEKAVNRDFLKMTSCNTTGLVRTIDCLDRAFGIERVALTIVRRVADPGDYNRGLVNALEIGKLPNHQAVDLMAIMPHVDATGLLVNAPTTHGHFISVLATPGQDISLDQAREQLASHDRIRLVSIDQGFHGNASVFRYARELGRPRGDVYEVFIWQDTFIKQGRDIMFGIHIPQESITIPETIDAIRAATGMQENREDGLAATNKFLNLPYWK